MTGPLQSRTNNVGHAFSQVFPSFKFVWGEGSENCKNISKRMHCFMRSPEKTENCEYCITVPRTSVHDCSRNFGLQYQGQSSFF